MSDVKMLQIDLHNTKISYLEKINYLKTYYNFIPGPNCPTKDSKIEDIKQYYYRALIILSGKSYPYQFQINGLRELIAQENYDFETAATKIKIFNDIQNLLDKGFEL